MTELEKAARQALEALMRSKNAVSEDYDLASCAYGSVDPDGHRYQDAKKAVKSVKEAITALRRALEQQPAQQQPKFSARDDAERLKSVGRGMSYNDASEAVWKHTLMEIAMRLETGGYTSPPAQPAAPVPQAHEWVGLTDEDKREIVTNNSSPLGGMLDAEAKLREKNA